MGTQKVLEKTGALAVSGYSTDIEFIPSNFLDILYFEFCQKYRKVACIERDLKLYYNPMAKKLGFKMIYEK